MLVPLTDSMFVPGTLASSSEVLIDIGTGYYLKKSIAGAVKILDKKVCFALGFFISKGDPAPNLLSFL